MVVINMLEGDGKKEQDLSKRKMMAPRRLWNCYDQSRSQPLS